jgi:hypothetical protein
MVLGGATFVFEEIAHSRPARQNQLGHIFDDLGLLLGRESGEPLRKALRRDLLVGFKPGGPESGWATRTGTHHFALSREQNQIARNSQLDVVTSMISMAVSPDRHFDGGRGKGWRNREVVEAVADPSSGETLWVEQRGGAPLQVP